MHHSSCYPLLPDSTANRFDLSGLEERLIEPGRGQKNWYLAANRPTMVGTDVQSGKAGQVRKAGESGTGPLLAIWASVELARLRAIEA